MTEAEQLTIECAHHWMIEVPSGPTSIGVCKKCGATKEFHNSSRAIGWGGEREAERKAASAKALRKKAPITMKTSTLKTIRARLRKRFPRPRHHGDTDRLAEIERELERRATH